MGREVQGVSARMKGKHENAFVPFPISLKHVELNPQATENHHDDINCRVRLQAFAAKSFSKRLYG